MADILDAAQTNTQPPQTPAVPSDVTTPPPPPPVPEPSPLPPVPEPEPIPPTPTEEPIPTPPPPKMMPDEPLSDLSSTASDNLIVPPPPEEPTPPAVPGQPMPPAPIQPAAPAPTPPTMPKPKKKSRVGVLLAVLLLLITLPVLTVFVRQQIELRGRAAGTCTTGKINTAGTCPNGQVIYVIRRADCTTYKDPDPCPAKVCQVIKLNTAGTCPDGTVKYVWQNADCSTRTDTCAATTTTAPTTPAPGTTRTPTKPCLGCVAGTCLETHIAGCVASDNTCSTAGQLCAGAKCDASRNQYSSVITSCLRTPQCDSATGVWTCPTTPEGSSCTTTGSWPGTCTTFNNCAGGNAGVTAGVAWDNTVSTCKVPQTLTSTPLGCCGYRPVTPTPTPNTSAATSCMGNNGVSNVGTGYCTTLAKAGGGVTIQQCDLTTHISIGYSSRGSQCVDTTGCCVPIPGTGRCDASRNQYSSLITSCLTLPTCDSNTGVWSCPPATGYCSGTSELKMSSAYTCVSVYHGTFNESNGQGCCTLGHSPNGNPSCTLASKPTCPNNGTPTCSGTTWSCPTVPNVPVTPNPGSWACNNGTGTVPSPGASCDNGGTYNGRCVVYHCPNGCAGTYCNENSPNVRMEFVSCASASLAAGECGQIDTVTDAGRYCQVHGACDVKALNCSGSCAGGTPVTPTTAPQCVNIVAYKDGNALSQSDLTGLQPGQTITLAFAPGGAATKVRFRVNSTNDADWHETTTKNSNAQFTWDYTLANATSFNIEAQWFDGSAWH